MVAGEVRNGDKKPGGSIFLFQTSAVPLAIAILCCGASVVAGEVDFSNRDDFSVVPSDNGAITLKWDHPAGTEVELQQAQEPSFSEAVVRYKGPDPASVITGLPEGSHFFRIRQADGEWSPPLKVKVQFFPRPKLFLLLGIGGLVVVATIATIVLGAAKTRREGRAV